MTQPTPRTAAETLRLRLLSQLPSDYHPMLDDLILEVRRNLLAQAASPEALDVERSPRGHGFRRGSSSSAGLHPLRPRLHTEGADAERRAAVSDELLLALLAIARRVLERRHAREATERDRRRGRLRVVQAAEDAA